MWVEDNLAASTNYAVKCFWATWRRSGDCVKAVRSSLLPVIRPGERKFQERKATLGKPLVCPPAPLAVVIVAIAKLRHFADWQRKKGCYAGREAVPIDTVFRVVQLRLIDRFHRRSH
ncbi:hypothetical protein CBM2592_A90124 [Cupriavidus taiwanensis]|nr:hypothetical protein CBM2592_A90124 [Cupriavidus taiwanensis]SOZ63536.1 hypothetical protein CBM2617_A70100 [Cupriavidus taiwanensis]SOZ82561.1 hypothetical protein CBM2618_A80101 [Cupriavidus taiwanensis]SOZ84421.1 hypothetical protein CBM2622_A80100 [Cupriavidus taiwanensis]SOZ92165.1 hypothetical protein CBM2621_A80100 [Cupriavidus taiwanensis]